MEKEHLLRWKLFLFIKTVYGSCFFSARMILTVLLRNCTLFSTYLTLIDQFKKEMVFYDNIKIRASN